VRAVIYLACLTALPAFSAPLTLKVQLHTAKETRVVEIPLERYVASVLAGESSVFQSADALKAMAVAARTYAVRMRGRHSSEGFDLCDTTHCQRSDLNAITPRLEKAALETSAELLWFKGRLAFTPYTRDCGGLTENAADVWPDLAAPYLVSHTDPYCKRTTPTPWRWNADATAVIQALYMSQLRTPKVIERISITQRTSSGRASVLTLAGENESVRISASSFRFAMGRALGWNTMRSDRFEIHSSNRHFLVEGIGEGHGVGLCQRGAEQMGSAGNTYRQILAFYYPGAVIGPTAQGLSWQRLGGEVMTLVTTQPDQDRAVLTIAERQAKNLLQRERALANGSFPSGIELRVYPDLDTFRNATAEPGWVAAHTEGRVIHLQPLSVLRSRNALDSTLSHELLHVLVESQSAPNLPIWFREGYIGYLEGHRASIPAHLQSVSDADLRQTQDPSKARRAYSDAASSVVYLVKIYGVSTVTDWVRRGLPAAVANASNNQAPVNSK
jgi:stage II sporulation protein D